MSAEIISLKIRQTNGTEDMMKKITHLLNNYATLQESTIRYKYSDMKLYIYSDSSYQSKPGAKTRVVKYFWFRQKLEKMKSIQV